jgi:hypothetical protein
VLETFSTGLGGRLLLHFLDVPHRALRTLELRAGDRIPIRGRNWGRARSPGRRPAD